MTGTGSFFVVFLSGPLATKSSAATLLPPPPSAAACRPFPRHPHPTPAGPHPVHGDAKRSEEHTSELQSLMRISYAVFCLTTQKKQTIYLLHIHTHHYLLKYQMN